MVIEIVDTQEKIDAFLPHLEPMMSGGLVTLERVQVIHYQHEPLRKSAHR
jgi:PII-like signaling protein